jgi:hypothetical protein
MEKSPNGRYHPSLENRRHNTFESLRETFRSFRGSQRCKEGVLIAITCLTATAGGYLVVEGFDGVENLLRSLDYSDTAISQNAKTPAENYRLITSKP